MLAVPVPVAVLVAGEVTVSRPQRDRIAFDDLGYRDIRICLNVFNKGAHLRGGEFRLWSFFSCHRGAHVAKSWQLVPSVVKGDNEILSILS